MNENSVVIMLNKSVPDDLIGSLLFVAKPGSAIEDEGETNASVWSR